MFRIPLNVFPLVLLLQHWPLANEKDHLIVSHKTNKKYRN